MDIMRPNVEDEDGLTLIGEVIFVKFLHGCAATTFLWFARAYL